VPRGTGAVDRATAARDCVASSVQASMSMGCGAECGVVLPCEWAKAVG
jgi:hypothetical protein